MGLHFGTLRQWHWVSSAVCLVGILLFAITGVTLNHAHQIPAQNSTVSRDGQLDLELLKSLTPPVGDSAPLPVSVRHQLKRSIDVHVPPGVQAEWYEEEIYVPMPRPGGDAWLSIDLVSGAVLYEKNTRGAVAYLNDLHKGRNTGVAWSWFIDVFAVACVIFSITGLWLLLRLQKNRPATWPAIALGLFLPLIIIILFVH
ncbi:PepSY-associated TM helix domain-containing protein [Gilvimarinus sp. SDUM040013]|uniref:PepSY-associated TM helix domain-containing protein n=1 Tax=Gilvimarinus gilvus TaxID=3058038 RepID=A0ABU4RWR7_9GAMM|nr:PepSY-associated TM helix domain-containing protein [Gilvimarinus sp. SDUM040013]MDO3385669.1 PepSY-associated TM helix domain-containing protein [Gilvimarinus sp. SDUM040013]MDX6849307.1 PepSY-associated TM helix domain-containing protein [Gilvimarinus sp. SDUM040013]